MKNFKKKGFTIVELVIVIAVIAILSAVLIPTFSSLIKKANLSNDQSMVRNMNTTLAVEVVTEGEFEFAADAIEALNKNGFLGKYKTFSNGFHYCYNKADNKMYLVDDEDNVIYPEVVEKTNLWSFYNDSVEGKVSGINNYIAMTNIINSDNFEQSFNDGGTYTIDLNNYYIAIGSDKGSSNVTVVNGGFVSGNVGHEDAQAYEQLTAIESNKNYSYVVFNNVYSQAGYVNTTFDNCIFYNSSFRFEGNLNITNCLFVGSPINDNATIELYANNNGDFDIKIENCKFNNVGRPINISRGMATSNTRNIQITNCEFNGTTKEKYLIQIADSMINLAIKDCKFNSLGSAVTVIRLHETLFVETNNYTPLLTSEALANEFEANITLSGNVINEKIKEIEYVDSDGIDSSKNEFAPVLVTNLTNKLK